MENATTTSLYPVGPRRVGRPVDLPELRAAELELRIQPQCLQKMTSWKNCTTVTEKLSTRNSRMEPKYPTAWVETEDVQVGDQLVCLLADAQAYPTIEGWEDGEYRTTERAYRDFQVSGDVPWWVSADPTGFLRASRPGQALIVARK